jgi:hypothetical protein
VVEGKPRSSAALAVLLQVYQRAVRIRRSRRASTVGRNRETKPFWMARLCRKAL